MLTPLNQHLRWPFLETATLVNIDRVLRQYTFCQRPPHQPGPLTEGLIARLDLDHADLPIWFVDLSWDCYYPDGNDELYVQSHTTFHFRTEGTSRPSPQPDLTAGRFAVQVHRHLGPLTLRRWGVRDFARSGQALRLLFGPADLFHASPEVFKAMFFVGVATIRAFDPDVPIKSLIP